MPYKDPEKQKAAQAAWSVANRERILEAKRVRRAAKPEPVKAQEAKDRSKKHEKVRKLLDDIKLESGCVDCGYRDHACALDFDHVRGEKHFQVSRGLQKPLAILMAEVAKCDVRCANCHRVKTKERLDGTDA